MATNPRVFLSYSHDSPDHSDRVLQLAWALRDHGIDVEFDQFHNEDIVDWPRWCRQQINRENSDFIRCICTAEYQRRIEGNVPPDKGKGVYWEGSLLDDEIYDDKGNRRIIPVLFQDEPDTVILDFLRGWTYCRLNDFDLADSGYDHLLRILTRQAQVEKNPLGNIPVLETKRAADRSAGSPRADSPAKVDISRIVKYAPEKLIGREQETAVLDKALAQMKRGTKKRPRVLGFVALGGEGKTSLVAKWLAGMAGKDWPDCESVFAWSFYSQGSREQVAVSSDLFLAEALRFFGDPEMAGSAQGAYEKGQRLAEIVGGQRSLLILDGVEPLQYPPSSPTGSRLKDQGVEALLKGLAASSNGLCIVTTRYSIPDLAAFAGSTWHEEELRRLSREAGVALLKDCGVKGSERPSFNGEPQASVPSGPDADACGSPLNEQSDPPTTGLNEYEQLVEDVKGHALTLQILGQYLKRAHHGDIRRRDRVELAKADSTVHASHGFRTGHAFRAMEAYERWLERRGYWARFKALFSTKERRRQLYGRRELAVLRLLGLFDRPATADCVQALRKPPAIDGLTDPLVGLPDEDWEFTLTTLSDARLVSVNRAEGTGELVSLDAHPLIREYFSGRLKDEGGRMKEDDPSFSLHPSAFSLGHRRLYEHLCETTNEGEQPTLEDLQPLYQAVAHGCHAGLVQAVCDDLYFDRIRRGNECYAPNKLGAWGSELGAIACFFDTPWRGVSTAVTDGDQGWLLNEAANTLRALGRLTECLEPMRAGMDLAAGQEGWSNASAGASNLSELELTLGEVSGALSDAERSVTYADRSGDADWPLLARITHADALHQSGRRSEVESLFHEAEQMQAELQPAYPLLYSLQGFKYCDLLLAPAEREAWRVFCEPLGVSPRASSDEHAEGPAAEASRLTSQSETLEACRAVTDRANKALEIVVNDSRNLLDIALDHLTLSHAALYESLLSGSAISPSASPLSAQSSEIEAAVSGLRRAGQQQYLPLGLLTRAWQRSLLGRRTGQDSAQSDLDEAWEIASRGPMSLFMADIHLYRARLFGRQKDEGKRMNSAVSLPPSSLPYPWESVEYDLKEARRLIVKHGYGRRKEELEDAEAALLLRPAK